MSSNQASRVSALLYRMDDCWGALEELVIRGSVVSNFDIAGFSRLLDDWDDAAFSQLVRTELIAAATHGVRQGLGWRLALRPVGRTN